jgi:hypothetical protein
MCARCLRTKGLRDYTTSLVALRVTQRMLTRMYLSTDVYALQSTRVQLSCCSRLYRYVAAKTGVATGHIVPADFDIYMSKSVWPYMAKLQI